MVNDLIFVTSINKAINRAKIGTSFNLTILALVDIYLYYIDKIDSLVTLGLVDLKPQRIQLKQDLLDLRYKYPSVICNYKHIIPINNDEPPATNTAPTVDNCAVDLLATSLHTFTINDFLINFADAENDSWKYLVVYPLANDTYGTLAYQGTEVTVPITINIGSINLGVPMGLVYTRIDTGIFGPDNFNFKVSDDVINYLYSALQTCGISASIAETGGNLPPADIGDNTIYVENRVITVFTLADFTTGLQPPYNDPEGDLIDAIKIIDISNANLGVFKFNGVAIIVNQIIIREDIAAGLFTHEGPDISTVNSDVFEFWGRDEGSQIWVE